MAAPVQETMLDKAQTVQALDAARAISTEQKLNLLYPEWDEEDKAEEVAKILAEQTGTLDADLNLEADDPLDPVDDALLADDDTK
ncbi:hypothetical protein ACWWUY_02675 [Corynebacterium striatum]